MSDMAPSRNQQLYDVSSIGSTEDYEGVPQPARIASEIESVDQAQLLIGDPAKVGEASLEDGTDGTQLVLNTDYGDGSSKTTTFSEGTYFKGEDPGFSENGDFLGTYSSTYQPNQEDLDGGLISHSEHFRGEGNLATGDHNGVYTTTSEYRFEDGPGVHTQTLVKDGETTLEEDGTKVFTGTETNTFSTTEEGSSDPVPYLVQTFEGTIVDGRPMNGTWTQDDGDTVVSYEIKDGNVVDEDGNLVTAVADEDGNLVKDEDGNFVTDGATGETAAEETDGTTATPGTDFDDAEAAKLKADENYKMEFSYGDDNYYIKHNNDSGEFEAFKVSDDGDDILIDKDVQIGSKNTVDGFIEVRGVAGLKSGDALYIGHQPGTKPDEILMIEATHDLNNRHGDADLEASNLQALLGQS